MQEILDRKAAVKLTKQEMEEYQGPTQYISHHAVLKDSASTPVKMGGTVFGYLWDPRKGKDELSVRFPVNLSRKKRSCQ